MREYELELSDNPACTMGPAISIGWGYKLVRKEKLDDYEKTRPAIRNEKELRLSRQVREAIIKNSHFTRKEIRTANTSKARARFRRSRVLENSILARYEEKLERYNKKDETNNFASRKRR